MCREKKNAIKVIKILPAQNAISIFSFYHAKTNKIYMHNMYHQLLDQNKL